MGFQFKWGGIEVVGFLGILGVYLLVFGKGVNLAMS